MVRLGENHVRAFEVKLAFERDERFRVFQRGFGLLGLGV
jgi:hypothetical protein